VWNDACDSKITSLHGVDTATDLFWSTAFELAGTLGHPSHCYWPILPLLVASLPLFFGAFQGNILYHRRSCALHFLLPGLPPPPCVSNIKPSRADRNPSLFFTLYCRVFTPPQVFLFSEDESVKMPTDMEYSFASLALLRKRRMASNL